MDTFDREAQIIKIIGVFGGEQFGKNKTRCISKYFKRDYRRQR